MYPTVATSPSELVAAEPGDGFLLMLCVCFCIAPSMPCTWPFAPAGMPGALPLLAPLPGMGGTAVSSPKPRADARLAPLDRSLDGNEYV